MRKCAIIPAGLVIGLLLGSGVARADYYIKQAKHTDPFTVMGQTQAAKDETNVTWLSKTMGRFDNSDGTSVIVDPGKKVMYWLNHSEKTYSEIPLEIGNIIDKMVETASEDADEEEKAMAEQMGKLAGSMMQMDIKVTKTQETKKIEKWNCRKYVINVKMAMGGATSESWATTDVKIDPELYWVTVNALMSQQPGFEESFEEMKKIEGVIIYQETTSKAMGAEVRMIDKVVDIQEKAAPAGTYSVPAGYKKVEGM
ncbi:MAG: DUF4412 domain-containing protein [Candidatus Krumholzibacteria bacterium]|nr:DUF4412 domain-containing protein [Candidatus Krumholzibacteria bacterium]